MYSEESEKYLNQIVNYIHNLPEWLGCLSLYSKLSRGSLMTNYYIFLIAFVPNPFDVLEIYG